MATTKNQVGAPPLSTAIADSDGNISKAWAIWFRDLYKRTAEKRGNSIDENQAINEDEFNDVNASLLDVATALAEHVIDQTTHEVTGNIIGSEDYASDAIGGAVLAMALVADAISSMVSVTSPDITSAPLLYTQSWGEEVEALGNELKADLTQSITDLNAAIAQLNELITNSKTSKQMNS